MSSGDAGDHNLANIGPLACMLNGDPDNPPGRVHIKQRVLIQILRLRHIGPTELDMQRVRIVEITQFHSLNPHGFDTVAVLCRIPYLAGRYNVHMTIAPSPAQAMNTVANQRTDMSRTPIHPGEILGDELEVIGINAAELARQIRVPVSRVREILKGRRGITADTALRLGKWFGTTPQFWLNLQKSYELRLAQAEIGEALDKILARQSGADHEVRD